MGDCSFDAYYKQCNKQDTRILFSQVSTVQSAQNLIEITLAVVVGMSKRRDLRCAKATKNKVFSLEIREIGSLMWETL